MDNTMEDRHAEAVDALDAALQDVDRLEKINADMLAALEALHDDIAEYASINNIGGFDNHVMRMARAAIAKARGTA